jgi:hypothetical protein
MVTGQLTRLMRDGDTERASMPDLEGIHRRGRRRRLRTRATAGAAALATVAVIGGVWSALGPGDDATTVRAATQDHRVTGLTAYERRVLAQTPGSYEVDGTVVLPDVTDPAAEGYQRLAPKRIVGTAVPLGFHGSIGPMYLATNRTEEGYQDNAPDGSQVVIDPGPLWLGCLTWPRAEDCEPAVLAKDTLGRFVFLHGFGTDDFLRPGAEMELFTDDDFADRTWRQSLIGGFHGDDTARVLVEMTDGSHAEAQLDVDAMSPGNTLFWARLPHAVAWVRAYDADGTLLAEHRLRDCTDPVDCEVR